MAERIEQENDLQQFAQDIQLAAGAAGVGYDEAVIWKNLMAYEEYFRTSPTALRTTTKPQEKRDLSVRYIQTAKPHDPFAIALEKGLLTRQGHPIEQVVPELQSRFNLCGHGVDFSVQHGFEKVWPIFNPAVTVDDICSLTSMPGAIGSYRDHFARFNLKWISLLALDYWNKTMNLYFMIKDASIYPPERIAAMIADLGFKVPGEEELKMNSKTMCIYQTFSWESPRIERLCFVMAGPQELIPTHLHPVLERFVRQVPIRAPFRGFTYNTTYATHGDYYKVEADYTGLNGQSLGSVVAALPD